jgi:type II secretory pathway predicted ATPase ExeA
MRVEVMQHYGLTQAFSQSGYYEAKHHQQLIKDIKGAVIQGRLILRPILPSWLCLEVT